MKCESCQIREVEIELPKDKGLEHGIWDSGELGSPYKLCKDCCHRLENLALRPREFYNLASIHGAFFYLHDDFYDYRTGEATQPDIPVEDAEDYPFPTYEQVKNDLHQLINFTLIQYTPTEEMIRQIQTFEKADVLNYIIKKVDNNFSISFKAYEIIAKAVGRPAENWAREQWKNKPSALTVEYYAKLLCSCLEPKEAFAIITNELAPLKRSAFNEASTALIYLRSPLTLDWLELQTQKMISFTTSFGLLAASSEFSWGRCKKWLDLGRPLSLIALDALNFCLLKNYRGQSLWLKNTKPQLTDPVDVLDIQKTLNEYLKKDAVPRTKNVIKAIFGNLETRP